jgi:hypothetical protein
MARKKLGKSEPPVASDANDVVYAGGFNHRDEANALIAMAVRNGPIENLHAGKTSPLLEDETLSRITDEEMKVLMIAATKRLAELLRMRDADPESYRRRIEAFGNLYCRSWDREVPEQSSPK